MTETGILNRDIAAELARMGHTDRLLIAMFNSLDISLELLSGCK